MSLLRHGAAGEEAVSEDYITNINDEVRYNFAEVTVIMNYYLLCYVV